MVAKAYVPSRGDIVWTTLDPTRGHEQRGRRPALVVSPEIYNEKSGLALVCPLTTKAKGYPFEVGLSIKGEESVILVDQIRSLDWKERRFEKIITAPTSVVQAVSEYLTKLIDE
ncbi:MAG TPA: endoribonuclease MazF [Candidatus Paceibacterota bacterium]